MSQTSPKKSSAIVVAIKYILFFAVALMVGITIGKLAKGENVGAIADSMTNIIWLLPSLLLAVFIVLAVHEGGHVIGGLLAGDKFGFMTVGPLTLTKEKGKLTFKINRNLSMAGGLALMMPTGGNINAKKRALMVAGGPIMSLIFGLLMLAIYQWIAVNSIKPIQILITLLSFTSLGIFLTTIIPYKSGGFMSDGMQLLNIFRNNPESQQYFAILQLFAISQHGIRPAEYDSQTLSTSLLPSPNIALVLSAHLYHHYHFLDKQDIPKAKYHLDETAQRLNHYPEAFRYMVQLNIVFFEAFYHKNIEIAQSNWEQAEPFAIEKAPSYYIAKAALTSLKGETEDATQAIAQAKESLTHSQDKGMNILYQSQIQQIEQQISPEI